MRIRLFLVLMLVAQTTLAQQTTVGLRGHIVDAENNRPLRRVIVSLARGDDRVRPVLTDEEGRFEIELPDASSALVITKAGYASTIVEQDQRTQSRELEIRLPRGAAMSGRVIERGAPSIGARVIARRIEDAARGTPTYEADTDDLGEFRIGGLPAGQYTVLATSAPQAVRFPPDFVDREAVQGLVLRRRLVNWPMVAPNPRGSGPGETAARTVDVRAGEETGDVDFETIPLEIPVIPAFAAMSERYEGTITGRVVTPLGQPVASALVAISGNNQLRTVIADANGQFDAGRFRDGDYQIETGKAGYLLPDFTGHPATTTARSVRVGGDTGVHSVEIVLARGGAISGTIVDSAGEPFQGVLVRALRLRQDGGRTMATIATWSRLTDDRGRYRLFGLPSGSYLIVASLNATERASSGSPAPGFAPVYYPGTSHVESAQPVQVDVGNAITGLDLTFAVSSTARVKGTAVTAAGTPLVGRVSLVMSHRSGGVAAEPRVARVGNQGSFELTDVPPGDYVLQAFGDPGPGAPREFGFEYVAVGDNDPPPVEIKTTVGATLDGRFVAEGGSGLPLRAQSIRATPVDVDRSPAGSRGPEGLAVHDDGRFYLTGLFGMMRLTFPAPPGWYLKSISIGGVDVTDLPFDFGFGDETFYNAEVTISSAGARITGSIEDAAGKPTAASLVIFSVSRSHWFAGSRHLKRAPSSADGLFNVEDLPPGEYFMAAFAALPTDWQSPQVLDAVVAQATRVTVGEGQTRTLTLRLTRRYA